MFLYKSIPYNATLSSGLLKSLSFDKLKLSSGIKLIDTENECKFSQKLIFSTQNQKDATQRELEMLRFGLSLRKCTLYLSFKLMANLRRGEYNWASACNCAGKYSLELN